MTEKILQAVYETASDDIVLVRQFPPTDDGAAPSYFGGLPRLPAEFNWPYSDYIGKHVSFLAQIDLASLPAIQWRSRLPAQGTLFFFANTAFDRYEPDRDKWGHVLFAPYPCIDVEKRDAPSDLMLIHGDAVSYYAKWLTHEDRGSPLAPHLFPYWPVEPTIIRTFATQSPTAKAGNPDADHVSEARAREERRILNEVFGAPTPKQFVGNYYAEADGGPSRLGALPPAGYPLAPIVYRQPWLPDDTWPYSWVFAEIFCAQLMNNIHRHMSTPEPIEESARSWRMQAQANGLFSTMSSETRVAFRDWVKSIPLETAPPTGRKGDRLPPTYVYKWIAETISSGVDACLGYARSGDNLFPGYLLPLIAWRHRAYTGDEKSHGFVRHQLLGAPRAVQNAVDEYGSTHLLLAQFDYDVGCLWQWGDVGALQFWIRREDLAVLRFDRAIMTMESG